MAILNKDSITGNNQFSKDNADTIIDAVNDNIIGTIQLPTNIYAVVGDTIQLFYRSMIIAPNSEHYHFRVNGGVGHGYPKYFEWTPDVGDIGSHVITIQVVLPDFTVLGTASTTIIVRESVQQPAIQTNVWSIGASTTAAGVWTAEFERRITGTGGTPAGDGYGNFFQKVEGNSGYDWVDYAQDPDRSPFIFSGIDGDLDFEQYRSNEGLDAPTVMYIFLTWNGMTYWRTDAQWDLWDNDVYYFIDQAKLAYPNLEVKLMAQLYPSLIGGLGEDYAPLGVYYSDSFTCIKNQKRMALIYDRISNEASYSSWVQHIDVSLQHDAVNNVRNFQKPVNTRNSNTELFGDNGLHPNDEGYYQVADAAYRSFISNYCQ